MGSEGSPAGGKPGDRRPAGGGRAGRSGREGGAAAPRGGLRERAHAFAFEGLPDKDRFGIFDPALRASTILGVMLAAVLGAGTVFDAAGKSGPSIGAAVLLVAAVCGGGLLLYRRTWPTESERELLLRMAREDDESRAIRAKLSAERGGRGKGS